MENKEYSSEEVDRAAAEWCSNHPGWVRYCDIVDTDRCYKTWGELSQKERKHWAKNFDDAKRAWETFGAKPCKYPEGYVSGAGFFYWDVLEVPIGHNFMTVIKLHNKRNNS